MERTTIPRGVLVHRLDVSAWGVDMSRMWHGSVTATGSIRTKTSLATQTTTTTTSRTGQVEVAVYDENTEFRRAVSSLAAIEGAVGRPGHAEVLPFLGMARAELVEFGQRQPGPLIAMSCGDVADGLRDLEARLTALLDNSHVLQHTLRLDVAREHVRDALRSVS